MEYLLMKMTSNLSKSLETLLFIFQTWIIFLSNEDVDSDEADENDSLADLRSNSGGFPDDFNEDTKSRFTEYSMTSSVIRRNAQLTLLDDRFEQVTPN